MKRHVYLSNHVVWAIKRSNRTTNATRGCRPVAGFTQSGGSTFSSLPFSPSLPFPSSLPLSGGSGGPPPENFELLLCRRWVLAHFGFEFVDQSSTGFLSILWRLNFFVLLNWRHLDWPIFMEYSQVYGTNINNNFLISQQRNTPTGATLCYCSSWNKSRPTL